MSLRIHFTQTHERKHRKERQTLALAIQCVTQICERNDSLQVCVCVSVLCIHVPSCCRRGDVGTSGSEGAELFTSRVKKWLHAQTLPNTTRAVPTVLRSAYFLAEKGQVMDGAFQVVCLGLAIDCGELKHEVVSLAEGAAILFDAHLLNERCGHALGCHNERSSCVCNGEASLEEEWVRRIIEGHGLIFSFKGIVRSHISMLDSCPSMRQSF